MAIKMKSPLEGKEGLQLIVEYFFRFVSFFLHTGKIAHQKGPPRGMIGSSFWGLTAGPKMGPIHHLLRQSGRKGRAPVYC